MVEIQPDRVAELEKTVAALVERVDTLEKRRDSRGVKELRDRLEDVLDHLYGANVRPPLKDREDYPADVVPTSADEGSEQFEKDVRR